MKILYIDDDYCDIELFTLKARHIDPSLEIANANTSAEALERTNTDTFDCIVADFRLDNEDGLQLLMELRGQGVETPIIFFTGMGNESIAAEAMRRGASDYFVKDFESEYMQRLFNRMRELSTGKHEPAIEPVETDILNGAPDFFLTIDLDGRPLSANAAARNLFSFSEVEQRSIFELLPGEEAKSLRTYLHSCLIEKNPRTCHEITLPSADGTEAHMEINAAAIMRDDKAVGICLIARDISERQAAEAENHELLERLRVFTSATQEGLLIHDNGIIVDVNESFARVFGVPRKELIGKNAQDFVTAEYRELIDKNAEEDIKEPYEVDVRRADGTLIRVEVQGSSVYSKGKRYRVVAARDLTRQRRVENDLHEKTEKLEAFNSMVSHDLRTPLWRISSYADMIEASIETKEFDTVRTAVGKMRESISQTTSLINDLLTYSRIKKEELTREVANLSLLAREAAITTEEMFPKKEAAIEIDNGVTGRGDVGMLRIVLENLFNNARKYSSHESLPEIRFGVDLRGDEAVYYVRDNGIGFPPEQQDEIFTPFRRLHSDNEYSGTGVGLATVKRIIELHNGRVWAESDPGKGATFYFTLG